jgi:predicted nuclease with TOPRIM domain
VREQLRKRLEELRAEYRKGEETLEELEGKLSSVRSMMLRLSGAIQVLQEELDRGPDGPTVNKDAAPASVVRLNP